MIKPEDIPVFLFSLVIDACLVWLSFLIARTLKKKDKFGAGLIGVGLLAVLALRVGIDVGLFTMIRDIPRAVPDSAITTAAPDATRRSLARRSAQWF